ncbi:hypothetical protein BHE74_00016288 [Ensete ventricosum]|nr:hypothetical protein BHE74_00016288 [Ensete ventricosum]
MVINERGALNRPVGIVLHRWFLGPRSTRLLTGSMVPYRIGGATSGTIEDYRGGYRHGEDEDEDDLSTLSLLLTGHHACVLYPYLCRLLSSLPSPG